MMVMGLEAGMDVETDMEMAYRLKQYDPQMHHTYRFFRVQ